jgi:hypothetical protein
VGETHGKTKTKSATLKGLNINILRFNPFRVVTLILFLPPVLPVVIQILSLRDIVVNYLLI